MEVTAKPRQVLRCGFLFFISSIIVIVRIFSFERSKECSDTCKMSILIERGMTLGNSNNAI